MARTGRKSLIPRKALKNRGTTSLPRAARDDMKVFVLLVSVRTLMVHGRAVELL